MVHIWGVLGSIVGPPLRINNWAPSETTFGGFPRIFAAHVFRNGFKVFVALVFWLKNRFLEKGMVAIPFSIFWLWWLLVDVDTGF